MTEQMRIQSDEAIRSQYEEAVTLGLATENGWADWATYGVKWNALVPTINQACTPMATMDHATQYVVRYGPDQAREWAQRAQGRVCDGCASGLAGAVELAILSVDLLAPARVVREAEEITQAANTQ